MQLLVTDEQAELAAAALLDVSRNEDLDEASAGELGRLSLLFQDASENPSKYPPTGELATTVRTIIRRAKGAAQPKPLNKRKARQEARMRTHKERRKFRRQIAEGFNKAREIVEAEKAEAEEAYQAELARIAAMPKFDVVDREGRVVLADVPEEFIVRQEAEAEDKKVIVPGQDYGDVL